MTADREALKPMSRDEMRDFYKAQPHYEHAEVSFRRACADVQHLLAEVGAAEERIVQILARQREDVLSLRGLDEESACNDCGGMGIKLYGNTSTWRGGIGGAMLTNDVCDKCWGSGDANRPWPDWRRLEGSERLKVERGQLKAEVKRLRQTLETTDDAR